MDAGRRLGGPRGFGLGEVFLGDAHGEEEDFGHQVLALEIGVDIVGEKPALIEWSGGAFGSGMGLDFRGEGGLVQVRQVVRYERPRVWSAVVFNAEQIEGLAPAADLAGGGARLVTATKAPSGSSQSAMPYHLR